MILRSMLFYIPDSFSHGLLSNSQNVSIPMSQMSSKKVTIAFGLQKRVWKRAQIRKTPNTNKQQTKIHTDATNFRIMARFVPSPSPDRTVHPI